MRVSPTVAVAGVFGLPVVVLSTCPAFSRQGDGNRQAAVALSDRQMQVLLGVEKATLRKWPTAREIGLALWGDHRGAFRVLGSLYVLRRRGLVVAHWSPELGVFVYGLTGAGRAYLREMKRRA